MLFIPMPGPLLFAVAMCLPVDGGGFWLHAWIEFALLAATQRPPPAADTCVRFPKHINPFEPPHFSPNPLVSINRTEVVLVFCF